MIAVLQKGSEDVKITHVKIRNYRNLRNIDIGLAETVTIIGENNSGKSNFLKAITLPFLTDDNTHISKKLSWTDINNETKKCYYKKIIQNQNKIKNDEITVEQFAEFLPIVSVEVNINASGAEEYYVKDMSYAIEDGEIQYGIKYEFAPKNFEDIFRVVKEVVSQTEFRAPLTVSVEEPFLCVSLDAGFRARNRVNELFLRLIVQQRLTACKSKRECQPRHRRRSLVNDKRLSEFVLRCPDLSGWDEIPQPLVAELKRA